MNRIKAAVCLMAVAAVVLAQGCSKAESKFVGVWKETESEDLLELLVDRTVIASDDKPNGKWEPLPDNKVKVELKDGGLTLALEGKLDGDKLVFTLNEGGRSQTVALVRVSPDEAKALKARQAAERSKYRCINDQRMVESAVEQWTVANNVAEGAPVVEAGVLAYLKDGTAPRCPATGKPIAIPAKVSDPVRCPSGLPEHQMSR